MSGFLCLWDTETDRAVHFFVDPFLQQQQTCIQYTAIWEVMHMCVAINGTFEKHSVKQCLTCNTISQIVKFSNGWENRAEIKNLCSHFQLMSGCARISESTVLSSFSVLSSVLSVIHTCKYLIFKPHHKSPPFDVSSICLRCFYYSQRVRSRTESS